MITSRTLFFIMGNISMSISLFPEEMINISQVAFNLIGILCLCYLYINTGDKEK